MNDDHWSYVAGGTATTISISICLLLTEIVIQLIRNNV